MLCFYKIEYIKEKLGNIKVENNFIKYENTIQPFNINPNIFNTAYYVEYIEEIRKETKVVVLKYEDLLKVKEQLNCKFVVIDECYNFDNYFEFIKNDGAYYLVKNDNICEQIFSILNYIFPSVENKVEIDNQLNKIKIDNKIITLTTKEILVFEYLNNNRNKLCLRKDILVEVLKYHPSSDSRIVDVYIRYLRIKLEDEGEKIKTIRGKGYIYEEK